MNPTISSALISAVCSGYTTDYAVGFDTDLAVDNVIDLVQKLLAAAWYDGFNNGTEAEYQSLINQKSIDIPNPYDPNENP